ncbi:hypothetical protein IWW39_003598 [Coemansia spiralis]|uniref:Uncharacterized protein n=1 Tax=Coemansia spiralis TaxID=417178 RepID=A0A9W8GKV2_9FUNG|nr:hypothetical protein IWW39_003598 [Coemansia spiralis]
MAILVLKGRSATVFHPDDLDPKIADKRGVKGVAQEIYESVFGLGSYELSVYAVGYDCSVKKLAKKESKISSHTEFVCVAVDDVIDDYLESGSLHSHLRSCFAVYKKSE